MSMLKYLLALVVRHKIRRRTAARFIPSLPPELWMTIMRYASEGSSNLFAGPHGQLGTSEVSFLDVSHSHSDLIQRLGTYRTSVNCKAAMSLVSKEWHWLVQPLLYEFVWISRAAHARSLAATVAANEDLGLVIRRLHIETTTLERCDSNHLRTIIEHAPQLAAYSDYCSIRRKPHSSPDHLLSTLARPGNSLKRLSWTNYDYDRRDHSGILSFFLRLSPALGMAASDLDYLELSLCATDLVPPAFPSALPDRILNSLSLHSSTNPVPGVHLPALRTLKLTLDNTTFAVLSTWSMPALRNISVLSADFSYTGNGFARFFKVHGDKIIQLELGHSTGAIEEHYLTAPPNHTPNNVNLAEWCPNLREFICSADAEWNWQSPDWIEPHMLLPSHPNVQLIGIRDLDKRLNDDLDMYLIRHGGRCPADGEDGGHGPFFRLGEQLRSLIEPNAFPNLVAIRDLSYDSCFMRREKFMYIPRSYIRVKPDMWKKLGKNKASKEMNEDVKMFGKWLMKFWENVLIGYGSKGVVLKDWAGDLVPSSAVAVVD